jgi:hypothetical protein
MAISPIWITPAGDLGIVPEQVYYEIQFDSYNTSGSPLVYSVVTGKLPAGLSLSTSGLLSGIPNPIIKLTTNTFTIRVKNGENKIADRTFSLSIGGIVPPVILPNTTNLGFYTDGTKINIQLASIEPNALLTPVFTIISGALPNGVTLSKNGLIQGVLRPIPDTGLYGPLDGPLYDYYHSITPTYGPDFDWTNPDYPTYVLGFDEAGFDSSVTKYASKNFQFTVQVNDGINTDIQEYSIYVFAGDLLTADSTIYTADNNSITGDQTTVANTSKVYSPVINTPAGNLGSVSQGINVAFKIDAEDFNNPPRPLTYETIPSNALDGSGLTLNAASGWITGTTSAHASTYAFNARAFAGIPNDISNPYRDSGTVIYSITVLGLDSLIWDTPNNLGSINTGEVSKLFVNAHTVNNQNLIYELLTPGTLPIGLNLLNDGLITGRVSFQLFNDTSAFTTNSTTYTFTVAAYTADKSVYEERVFQVTVSDVDSKPYENLYAQLLPSRAQRDIFYSIINDPQIFPESYLYRASDPWFGKNFQRLVLLQSGLNSQYASAYVDAMNLNHSNKKLVFGAVKTARAVSNFETIYEVVYLELGDGQSADLEVNWPTNSAGVSTVYPNSFSNMAKRISDGIGYEDKSIIPLWMESRQKDGTVPGFKQVFVLCYTLPGKSAEIAYNINKVVSEFGLIDFTVDRYVWDAALSQNYDKSANVFIANNYVMGTGYIEAYTESPYVIGFADPITNTETKFTTELFVNDQIVVFQPNSDKDGAVLGTVKAIHSDSNVELYANSFITTWGNVKEPSAFKHLAVDSYLTPGEGDKYLKFPRIGVLS